MAKLNHTSPVLKALLDASVTTSFAFNTLVRFARHQGAGDLYVSATRSGFAVSIRRDGFVECLGDVETDWGERLIGWAKVEARMDSAERRRPQDGHIILTDDDQPLDLRVGIIPTTHGEDLAVRLLYRRDELLDLQNLGPDSSQINAVRDLIRRPHGLILVTGPTGSGKTTTLYSLIRSLNDGQRKINTLEDPIEYDLDGVHQSQINLALGLDFSELLPAVLRQDPDVIMVGEIRDPETAKIAVRAAVTGQLVLATLHATGCASAVGAMLGLGAHPHLLAHALRGVIAQTLVRQICTHCSRPLAHTGALDVFADIIDRLPPGKTPVLHQGRGCEECMETGYRNRTGVFEVMTVSPEMASLIESQAAEPHLHRLAVSQGMTPMFETAKVSVAAGITTMEEILRAIELPAAAPELEPHSDPVPTRPAPVVNYACI